jgi:signal peptidase I
MDQNDSPVTPEGSRTVEVEKKKKKSLVREYAEAIGTAILLALLIRTFVIQAFTIPSGSMMDTLLVGDYILVNKFIYGAELPFTGWHLPGVRQPTRGDIIVFKYPLDEKRDFVKRVVGLPGEKVTIKGQTVSQDSRYWGFVTRDKNRGRGFLIYWSWDGDQHWLRWRRLGNYIP